jgi:arginase family enzyme
MAFDYAQTADVPAGSRTMRAILDAGAACFAMGGDHSVTLPLLRAHVAKHGPVALIQVDAHTDTWPDDDPGRIDHGTFCYTAVKRRVDRRGALRPCRHPHGGGRQPRHRHPRRTGGASQGGQTLWQPT